MCPATAAPPASLTPDDMESLLAPARPWWWELGSVVPRSVAFSVKAARSRDDGALPRLRPTPLSWATVAVDELAMSTAYLVTRRSGIGVSLTVQRQSALALTRLRRAGVLDDPTRLHPKPATPSDLRRSDRARSGTNFEHVSFASTWTPPVELPGGDAWRAPELNGRVHAYLLRHGDRPRPWVVVLHGTMMGEPRDLRMLGSARLQAALGVDVAHLVLPMHGPRSRGTGHPFPGLDPVLNLIGMSQAVHDARALIAALRAEAASAGGSPEVPVGVFGISLGGHVAALLAAFEPDLGAVVAGVPTADHSTMLADTMRGHWGEQTVENTHVSDAGPRALSALVSPLHYPPAVARERRFVYGAAGDRLVTPEQAASLWRHWERPDILWLQGGHILNNVRAARRFVIDAMRRSGVVGH